MTVDNSLKTSLVLTILPSFSDFVIRPKIKSLSFVLIELKLESHTFLILD
jgi:hypothetical protein